jgi:aspartyl-tRNA(Asn)/glutamyl-tRNA(Gln) amidotransferase subunit A
LKQAGAILLGKTNTHEFALGVITPPTRNPWNPECIPGGSSGGSAAAVAASSAVAATGSDTGGSIRIPASCCGIVGLKPTYGLASRSGVFPESWSLDHVGPITKRVEDAALILSVMAGYDENDPSSAQVSVPDYVASLDDKLHALSIGVPNNYFFDECNERVRDLVLGALKKVEEFGCKIAEFEFPYVAEITSAYRAIVLSEASSFHEITLSKRATELGEDSRQFLDAGLFIPATTYIKAQRIRAWVFEETQKLFRKFDAIVTPTLPMVAPEVKALPTDLTERRRKISSPMSRYVSPFNLTGLPAISIPCGFTNGLPVGAQLISKAFDEITLFRIGYAYQQATDWHLRFPEL